MFATQKCQPLDGGPMQTVIECHGRVASRLAVRLTGVDSSAPKPKAATSHAKAPRYPARVPCARADA